MKPLVIMSLVLVEVALWQWRVALTGRGQLLLGALLGGTGAVIQITVILRVVGDLGNVASVAGYAAGVGFGVAIGGLLDRRTTPQLVKVQLIAPSGRRLPDELRREGWPMTTFAATGADNALDVVNIAIEERYLADLETIVDGVAPDAGWIVERVVRGRGLQSPAAA